MKTIHSQFLIISLLFLHLSSVALNPLPEVTSLKWDIKDQRVTISWSAISDESDIVYFIEKSHDGKAFTSAGVVLGGFQNNNQFVFTYRLKYQSGIHYRIKQVNKAGDMRVLDEKIL